MDCPKCNSKSEVNDSRPTKDNSVRRRRQCKNCGFRFTTHEIFNDTLEVEEVEVIKYNGNWNKLDKELKKLGFEVKVNVNSKILMTVSYKGREWHFEDPREINGFLYGFIGGLNTDVEIIPQLKNYMCSCGKCKYCWPGT